MAIFNETFGLQDRIWSSVQNYSKKIKTDVKIVIHKEGDKCRAKGCSVTLTYLFVKTPEHFLNIH